MTTTLGDDLLDPLVDQVVRRLGGRILTIDGQASVLIESLVSWPFLAGKGPAVCSVFDPSPSAIAPLPDSSRVVFLDIETTGLNGGAGTLVFVVGLAAIRDEAIQVWQFFLHEPASESAFLLAVGDFLKEFDSVVTFNGRRFDLPLLVGRYDLHRMADPTPSRHVDLLQPARRIWARRLGQSNLSILESRVLGVSRFNDLSGSEAPGRYFDFLHDRCIDGLIPVLDHNRQDLISMVLLADRIGSMLADAPLAVDAMPSDFLGLGSLLEDSGRVEAATWCYEAALVGASINERAEALFRLARLADRNLELDRIVQLLTAVATFNVDRAVLASIELAKIHEHRKRQPDVALQFARRALDLTQTLPYSSTRRIGPEVAHRIQRLERKAANRSEAKTQ